LVTVATLALVGCTSQTAGRPEPAPSLGSAGMAPTAAASSPSGRPGPRLAPAVRQPLDARGIKVCDVLTPDQLVEVGLLPGTGRASVSGIADVCGWDSTDPGNPGGLQLSTHPESPVLDGIYLVRDTFAVFEPLEVAGHPAVHADLTPGSGCVLYVAIADYQGIAVGADTAGRPSPDPCARSRRMAELILSNLPPMG
jgi:hypothetical protein